MKSQAESATHHGSYKGVLGLMKLAKLPMTRETFLDVAYAGHPPKELSAEEEENLPPQFRREPVVHGHHHK